MRLECLTRIHFATICDHQDTNVVTIVIIITIELRLGCFPFSTVNGIGAA